MIRIDINNLSKDKELVKMYQTNSEFHNVVEYLQRGVTEHDLLVFFKEICLLNDEYKNQLVQVKLKGSILNE